MKAFVAIVALIACALAQSIPENMCSVQAFGLAGLSLDGQYPTSYNGAMYRVGDYAMYGILTDKKELVAGVLVRPDLNKTFFWMNEQGCFDRPALNLSSYKHDEDKSFNVTVSDSYGIASGIISFDDSDKLQTESIIATYMDEQENYHYVSVTFVYSSLSLNYSYVNEDETWFSLDDSFDTCDSSSMNPAPEGKTSVQCPAPPTPSGSGSTPSGSGSTPSGSGSTPSGSGSTPSGGEIPDNMCSVQAFGTAVLMIDNANPVNYKGGMVRVGDYVMYAVYTDNDDGVAAVLVRPDLDKTFLWMNGQGCMDRPALKLSTYQPYQGKMFTQTVQDPAGLLSGLVSFDGSDKLTSESVSVFFSDGKETHSVTVSIVYDTWNYSFVNEDDDFFEMMDDFQCGASSLTPSREGKTSVQCHAPPPTPSGSTSSGKTSELPADMCSVEAIGSAVLSYDGYPYLTPLYALMMRVKNYAQYALVDSITHNLTAAVLIRPDTGKTYLWMAEEDCIERPALNLFSYEHVAGKTFSKTVTDPYGDLTGSITFDGSDKLSAETIQVAFTQGGENHTVSVTITYTPILVNYSFVNEDDDEFMAPADMSCGAASMTPAADAKTSLQCSATSSTKPTPSTSSSTKPTPPPPASSSAASFVVPSAMLLVAAVVAMF